MDTQTMHAASRTETQQPHRARSSFHHGTRRARIGPGWSNVNKGGERVEVQLLLQEG